MTAAGRNRHGRTVSERRQHGSAEAELACGVCASPDVRRLSLVHEAGIGTLAGGTLSTGFSRSEGVRVGGIAGKTTSGLSARTAPPAPRSTTASGVVVCLAVILIMIGLTDAISVAVIGAVLLAFAARSLRAVKAHNRDVYPAEMAAWRRSFMCMRCGHMFQWGA